MLVACSKAPPTVSLSANSGSVEQGKCATLTWSSTNATGATIDQGVGKVDANGSKEVCPPTETRYTITATGEGGTQSTSTTIAVTQAAATANVVTFPEAALFATNKSELKPEGKAKIEEYRQQAKEQLSRADHVLITGHTDNVGGAEHNSELSLKRAEAVRDYLVSEGTDPNKITVNGAG